MLKKLVALSTCGSTHTISSLARTKSSYSIKFFDLLLNDNLGDLYLY
jgi:hypothetical protein